jgi:two-component system phosphate regulon sensor histidine kinase PhoR
VSFGDDVGQLKQQLSAALQRVQELEAQQASALAHIKRLEGDLAKAAQPVRAAAEPSLDVAPINEADVTLRRLVQRIAMILQAEKIVIMFYDREQGELIGIPPSYGVDEERLKVFRVRASTGISGQVFRDGEAVIFHDANNDPRAQKDPFSLLHAQNGVTVPLVIERRDEENRVVERNTIGVLHAFNKRHGEDFNDEDVRLLERMARNVGSIISNLQLYREVVEEREELAQTFESLSAGLILVSPEGRLSQMNATARAIFGQTAEAIGKNAREALNNDELWQVLEEAHGGGEGSKRDIHVSIQGSERIYEVQAAQVRNEEGKELGVVTIFNDITEMKNIDKMKSSFVAMASHELRTPLTAIKGFVSTLLMGEDDFTKDERIEFHQIIDQECDRLRRLIDDLLNTARIEAGESLKPNYTRFKLLPVMEKAVTIQQQASSKHMVSLDVQNQLPDTIVGDEDKLDQILTNLLNNAIKYSPAGGNVWVHVKNEGDAILIGVEDQGMGIPKEHLTKVFERFHRVDNEDNRKIYGTGLGLYLVQHLVEQVHLGKIWAESEVGVGSTFWFRIPVELDIDRAKAGIEEAKKQ